MGVMRNLAEMLGAFRLASSALRGTGGPTAQASVDTWNAGMGMGCSFLALIDAGAIGTSLDVTIEHSTDNATWATAATLNQITAAGLYYRNLTHLNRYVRAQVTMVGNCNFSIALLADLERRAPHSQTGTLV